MMASRHGSLAIVEMLLEHEPLLVCGTTRGAPPRIMLGLPWPMCPRGMGLRRER